MNCPNCNKKLNEDEMFCLNCGQFIDNESLNPVLAENTDDKQDNSNAYLTEKDILAFEEKEKSINETKETKKKTKTKKGTQKIKTISVFIAILILALPLISFAFSSKNKGKKTETLVYLKDEQLLFADNKIKPIEKPKNLLQKNSDFSRSLALSSNKKYFLYGIEGNDLYYKKTNSKNSEQLIDTNILKYFTNYDASKIVYGKGTDVFYYDKKESNVLSSNIYAWMINKKSDKILLWDYNNNLHSQGIDKKAKQNQIDKNVTDVFYVSEDFKHILYDKDGSLMLKSSNKEPEKIAADVFDVFATGDDANFFYLCEGIKTFKIKDFFKDDFADSDLNMKKPSESEYQKQETYTDIWGKAQVRTITDHEALNEANNAYEKKLLRDEIREEIEKEILIQDNSLYYYNGSKSVLVSDGINSIVSDLLSDSKKQVIIYTKQDHENLEKINIADIERTHVVKTKVNALLEAQTKHYIAINKTEYFLSEDSNIKNININSNADSVFYMTEYDYKTKTGNLRKANIRGSKITENSVIVEAVHSYVLTGSKQAYVYFKSVSSSIGDMYYDGKKIASDVLLDTLSQDQKSNLKFLADYDSSKKMGSLYDFDGKKTNKITDDVYSQNFLIDENENVLYFFKELKAENKKSKPKGDLYLSNGKKTKLIDTEVYSFALINQEANLF